MEKTRFLLKAPICVGIITTNRCNLKCKHCMNNATVEETVKELSTEEIISIIDQSVESGVQLVEFNGGEFFVRTDNEKLLDYCILRNMPIVITTNGTLISESWIEKYKGKISLLRISLDSHIEEQHDEFRGVQGAFRRTTQTIKLLKENNYNITVLTTITRSRLANFKDYLDFLAKLGVDGLHTTLLIPAGRGKDLIEDALTPEEHKIFLEKYREYKKSYSNTSFTILEESPQTCLLEGDREENEYYCKCGAAFTEIVILNDGYVLPCASFISVREKFMLPELNIRNSKIIDIYHNADIMKKVRDVYSLKDKCSSCEYLEKCGGGCRAAAMIIYDDIFAPDPMCWYKVHV